MAYIECVPCNVKRSFETPNYEDLENMPFKDLVEVYGSFERLCQKYEDRAKIQLQIVSYTDFFAHMGSCIDHHVCVSFTMAVKVVSDITRIILTRHEKSKCDYKTDKMVIV
jgi:hypothetical protein